MTMEFLKSLATPGKINQYPCAGYNVAKAFQKLEA
jgi:hypothetical protein